MPLVLLRGSWTRYERALQHRPVITSSLTSAILWYGRRKLVAVISAMGTLQETSSNLFLCRGLGDAMSQRISKKQELNLRQVAFTGLFGCAVLGNTLYLLY